MQMPLSPYKGSEPCIFISYAHRDSQQVFPILRQMQEDGYRLWYDDGIDPGTEWDENIARNIGRCDVFIAFVTEHYIQSKNCKDELSYSREKDKRQLLVYLQEVELPEGLKMRMNRLQAIFWYHYGKNPAGAYETLYGAPGLAACREVKPEPPEPSAEPRSEPAPAEEPLREQTGTQKAPPAQPGSGGTIRKILPVALAVIALAVILAVVLRSCGKGEKTDAGAVSAPVSSEDAGSAEQPAATEAAASESETPAEVEETGPEEAQGLSGMRHVVLTPDDAMTVKEYTAAQEILRQRLDILAGPEGYRLDEGADSMDLWLPNDCLAEDGLEYTLRCYVTRAMELYMFPLTYSETDSGIQASMGEGKLQLSAEDVEQATVRQGTVSGIDPLLMEYMGERTDMLESDSYSYVELVLTEDGANKLAAASADWEGTPFVGLDLTMSTWYYFYTVPGEDGRTFYILDGDQADSFQNLLAFNLTHERLAESFTYSTDMNETVAWERAEEPEVLAGEHQVNPEDLTGKTVTFRLKGYKTEYTQGEWYDLHTAVKERLDALDTPYAFAAEYSEEDDTLVTVMCAVERMNPTLMNMLGAEYWKLRSGLTRRSVYGPELTWEKTGDGAALRMEYQGEELAEISEAALSSGDGRIYLELGETAVMETTVDHVIEDGAITFDHISLGGSRPATADAAWLGNLLCTVETGTPLPTALYLDKYQSNPDENGQMAEEGDYAFPDTGTQEILDAIQAVSPELEPYARDATIYIQLHLPVDENLPETAVTMAKQVYDAFDFEGSTYTSITIYLVDEENDVRERGRIFFNKRYSTFQGDTEGFVVATGIFCNGRLEQYKEQMQQAVASDPFLVSLYHYDEEHTYYDWTWELE